MFAIVCQCSAEFAPQFRVLHASIRRFHPKNPVIVWTFGGDDFPLPKDVIRNPTGRGPEFIAINRAHVMRCALKDYETVLFLGADTEMFGKMDQAIEAAANYNLTMVPHLVRPLQDPEHFGVNEAAMYTYGMCNADFLVLNRRPVTFEILDWLHHRLNWRCMNDRANGYNNEQGWLSIAVSLFPDVHVWRTMCFNVARWNYDVYNFRYYNRRWVTDGGLLRLFHWSQFNFKNPGQLHPGNPIMASGAMYDFMYAYADRVQARREA